MAERLIRIGRVSSVNPENGMVSVTYPELDDSTTVDLAVFSFTDEYKMPGIGQEVLVLHLSNGQTAGVVMGKIWNLLNVPQNAGGSVFRKELGQSYGEAYIEYNDGDMILKDRNAGEIRLSQIQLK